ncbi:MAG: three-Cys-motif partner protein TcmP [Chitinispirillaceae bacterium]|nr:three-Cys-motif partner protein TcmP [Chitinispirillaceae bacterium]
MKKLQYDEIGYWSEVKLDIIKEYASAYTAVMAGQKKAKLKYIYIDAFSGAGQHISKSTGEFVPGSPLNALKIPNLFLEYHFIDTDDKKVSALENADGKSNNLFLYNGDCNDLLLSDVFPRAKYEDYKRALCLLDPYGLHLNWQVIKTAGEMKSIEIFLNFPIMDINFNVLKHDKDKVDEKQIARMNRFWGDDSWKTVCYEENPQQNMFGISDDIKVTNDKLAEAFRKRLKEVAGFKFVPEPMPMRNSNNAVVYYLYFASQNDTGRKIVENIFRKYSQRRDA